ncbi:MAG: hypothetical protein ACRDGA_12860 [Bacteroidota bacterium]
MKQVNNRQKMFVKATGDVQKFVVGAGRMVMAESRRKRRIALNRKQKK